MRIQAGFSAEYDSGKVAKAIANALEVDNKEVTWVKTFSKGKTLVTEFDFDGKVETFINTFDDLLACMITAEKALVR